MPDDPKLRGGQDRNRVSVTQEHEARYWSQKFGVDAKRLADAVQAVGSDAKKVQQYLQGGSKSGQQG